uniref:Uncharacterized protein n=1 Tax=Arundo donax TaxID=35708 RepID=A0A0A9FC50_ARUDO
MPDKALAN